MCHSMSLNFNKPSPLFTFAAVLVQRCSATKERRGWSCHPSSLRQRWNAIELKQLRRGTSHRTLTERPRCLHRRGVAVNSVSAGSPGTCCGQNRPFRSLDAENLGPERRQPSTRTKYAAGSPLERGRASEQARRKNRHDCPAILKVSQSGGERLRLPVQRDKPATRCLTVPAQGPLSAEMATIVLSEHIIRLGCC